MDFLARALEAAVAAYVAAEWDSGAPAVLEGHSSSTQSDTEPAAIVCTAGSAGGELLEAGIYTIPVEILIRTAATAAGLVQHDEWTQKVVNAFAGSRHDDTVEDINLLGDEAVGVSAVRIVGSATGRDAGRERHGTVLTVEFSGVFIPPAA